jgi:hypothetical protein
VIVSISERPISDVEQAYSMLGRHWPSSSILNQEGRPPEAFWRAWKACGFAKAKLNPTTTQAAREAFVAAAREAGVLVCE